MGNPVVHFEIIGADPAALRDFYGRLFGWEFDVGGPVAPSVSAAGDYGFTDTGATGTGTGIPGGIGGGPGYEPHVVFYVGVPDVEAALVRAESLGGTRLMGPEQAPDGPLIVGHFADPEGNVVGVAAPAPA
jgi:predicted enzyme related to lactoylglutathione lyase